jgi:hypothetical protein
MIFDAKEFEHFVDERSLKKGYRLFEKGLPELEKPSALEYNFHIGGNHIHIRKRGDKILSYRCTCGRARSCEHLGAAMFYFQRNALGISGKPGSSPVIKIGGRHYEIPHPVQPASAKRHPSLKQKTVYDECSEQLCEVLKPFVFARKLDNEKIGALHAALSDFLAKAIATHTRENHLCVYLAAYAELAPLFNLRFPGDETPLRSWYAGIAAKIGGFYAKGLPAAGREALQIATLRSLRNDKCLPSGAFEFLLPRYLCAHPSHDGLAAVAALLEKRNLKTGYLRRLDKLLIARIQLHVKTERGPEANMPFRFRRYPAECALAMAELDFCSDRKDKAFARLESALEPVRAQQNDAYQDYLNILIGNAARYHRTDLEIRYRKRSLLQAMFIRQDELDQLLRLFPVQRRPGVIKSLLEEMKTSPAVNTFDKIAALLLAGNQLDELQKEMNGQDLRFDFIHDVAMRKGAACDERFLKSYVSNLTRAMVSSQVHSHQMKLFGQAKEFFRKLSNPMADKASLLLLDGLSDNLPVTAEVRAFFRFRKINLN